MAKTPKKPTIYDVADLAGVSTFTVSRVINDAGPVRDQTRAKVESAIAELNYIPSAVARRLRANKSDMIGLVISDITNPFWAQVIAAIQRFFSDQGIGVILGNTQSDPEEERKQVELALSQSVDGIIMTPLLDSSQQVIDEVRARDVPCVILDRRGDFGVDVVRGDSRQGARELTELLLEKGHRRIGLVTGSRDRSTAVDRYQGYADALEAAGIEVEEALVRWGPYTRGFGAQAMDELLALDSPPTAVFAANNSLADGVLDTLRVRGRRVPGDMAVVGFDSIPTLDSFLTVAEQPAQRMGQVAAEMLQERIDGYDGPPRERVLPIKIRVRVSSG
jgi:LacI family transcriptional regulator